MPRPPGRHALAFIIITVLLDTIGMSLIIPVLPTLLVEITGESLSRAAIYGGWLALAYAGMQFIFAPVLGNLSDRFGRRPVLLAAVFTLGVDYLVMGFAPTLAWLFVGRLIAGIAGASFTPAYAFVADVTPPEKRAQNFGYVSAAFGLGFIIGPALGGLLGSLGPRTPFFVAAGLSLANFVYGSLILPESLPVERRRAFDWRRANPVGMLLHIRKQPMIAGLLGALFLWMLAHQVMPGTWAYYTKYRFAWSEAAIGASLALAGILVVLAQTAVLPRLVVRFGERRTALIGIVVAAIGYYGYGAATAGWMLLAWQFSWLLGATVMPASNALASRRIEPSAQGELQGALASLFSLSSMAGPPLMTHLFGHYSSATSAIYFPGAAFVAAGTLTALAFVVYYVSTREAAVAPAAEVVAAT